MKAATSMELFSGAGGLALGLERTGWRHEILIERDKHACSTLRLNEAMGHPLTRAWNVHECDVRNFDYKNISGKIDLVAGGPPYQPFSLGGKHGAFRDGRDMFPEAVRAVRELAPDCFIFENVKGLLRQIFPTIFNTSYFN